MLGNNNSIHTSNIHIWLPVAAHLSDTYAHAWFHANGLINSIHKQIICKTCNNHSLYIYFNSVPAKRFASNEARCESRVEIESFCTLLTSGNVAWVVSKSKVVSVSNVCVQRASLAGYYRVSRFIGWGVKMIVQTIRQCCLVARGWQRQFLQTWAKYTRRQGL